MAISPQTARVEALYQDMFDASDGSIESLRAGYRAMFARFKVPGDAVVDHLEAYGVPCLAVSAPGTRSDRVLMLVHGGGTCLGSADDYDEFGYRLSRAANCGVIVPDYRLAPEHPFPAAIDDAYAALQWAAEHAAELGGDPARIVIAGESAGATLAAIAAQRARDENGPRLAAQVLLYPPIHPTADTESRRLFPHGPVVGVAAVTQMWELYLGDLALQDSPLASPSNASSLEGLPPALVLTAEIDPTRDEAEAYGHALAAAGVPTEVKRLDGFIHATLNLGGYVPRTREIYEAINSFLAAHGQTAGSGAATGIR